MKHSARSTTASSRAGTETIGAGRMEIGRSTRGVGGLMTSCGEENLLRLREDRYRGRDICQHEFAHAIYNHGIPENIRQMFREQYQESLAAAKWTPAYAGSNEHEYFAELTMWYFGTRGDLGMRGEKPANGRAGLAEYDPDAYALFSVFYSGMLDISEIAPRRGRGRGGRGPSTARSP